MMEWIASIPVWLLCLLIFGLRVCDVTLGTVRTVAIVKGYLSAAVVLGFFEVLIWILAVSQVIVRINESIFLGIAFAGGFAAGNAVGILVERHLAMGTSVVRILSADHGRTIAEVIRRDGHDVSIFDGDGEAGPITLVYAVAPRRKTKRMLQLARSIDPDLLYVSEPAHESFGGVSTRLRPVPHATGWRAVFKKK
ncbi:MAG: DUF5698 domain-containing protein [Candidatus Sulfomarinibacteraceae bacterium]